VQDRRIPVKLPWIIKYLHVLFFAITLMKGPFIRQDHRTIPGVGQDSDLSMDNAINHLTFCQWEQKTGFLQGRSNRQGCWGQIPC
jgi:hypothetical protein